MTEATLIEASILNVDAKQKIKISTRNIMTSYTIQKSGVPKTWDY